MHVFLVALRYVGVLRVLHVERLILFIIMFGGKQWQTKGKILHKRIII